MSVFKLSNHIFDLGLTAKELSVYAYLCSIHSDRTNIWEEKVVHVKQKTIAQNCCIGSLQTIKKVLNSLAEKELIRVMERSVKRGGHKGTYYYGIKKLPTERSYFYAERMVFGKLNPRQMYIYFFICKSYDNNINDCWNSYNDISSQAGMKRETVIETIEELVKAKFIVKMKRKARQNRRVYVDNHYQVIKYVVGCIRHKKVRLYRKYNRTNVMKSIHNAQNHTYYNTENKKSQALKLDYFQMRGSP